MEKAKFYKVSYQQFEEGYLDCQPQANQAEIQAAYDAYVEKITEDSNYSQFKDTLSKN